VDYKTLKNNYEEKSEAEHKDLIITANNGLRALDKLTKKYSDVTKAIDDEGEEFDLGQDIVFFTTDIVGEK